jgi:endoglucanase
MTLIDRPWVVLALGLAAACAAPGSRAPARSPTGAAAPQDNPFRDARLWVDPDSRARGLSRAWQQTRPEDAAALRKIAENAVALWVGDWTPDPGNWVRRQVTRIGGKGYLPVFVLYNIPKRDCGHHSRGGAAAAAGYRTWIQQIASGIGGRKAVVILEPDGLPLLTKCLSPAEQAERTRLVRFAIDSFAALGATAVYVDAGHSDWVPAPEMAGRLRAAGIDRATGFSLNVSNYKTTEAIVAYGRAVSERLGGKPFVIDTSRNGNGPPEASPATDASWCNPDGRALGAPPTGETGDPLVHAYLWIKAPGESDGECNGGPKAGQWWTEQALGLARRAKF